MAAAGAFDIAKVVLSFTCNDGKTLGTECVVAVKKLGSVRFIVICLGTDVTSQKLVYFSCDFGLTLLNECHTSVDSGSTEKKEKVFG